ncbi:MAG TPA: S9 family peptidase [Maribacter sp.]|uniref:S9 family peptidase n=2 Tax=Maribacter TaxID=252356 RepID=UPI000EEA41D8|nr:MULTISPECIES: S9 family peptidase [unclassified Maribacter]HAF78730.1 S9 family peptidase [Maribacter sp.]HAI37951.1 S9 family peptidase [Maribacter sp.]|tara:strand:- start:72776 stop:74941 length:2166 start_codon:yes stop_codon:yes gene_type:complete
MRKTHLFTLILLSFSVIIWAQEKKISVSEIYQGAFRTEGLEALRSMNNGTQYTVLHTNRFSQSITVDKYDYKTLEKVGTVVSSADLAEIPSFSAYTFSDDEKKLLLSTEIEPIFRRSRLGVFYVYEIASKKVVKVSESKIQEPLFSPDGSQVAYVKDNNLYIFTIESGETKQITQDGVKNQIINGVTDWVYEEEFSFVRAFEWNADGSKIAFLRFDETSVPEFSMDVYGTGLYQQPHVFKYPKAGENNSKVTLHLLDVASGNIAAVDLNSAYYIPRIKWMNHKDMLSVQTLNRHQDHLTMYAVNAKKNEVSVLLEEKDDAYVDITDNLTFLEDDSFIWTSEKDGFNHIYLYGEDGNLMSQITKGDWEVTKYYGYDQNEDKIYYQSTENGSINRGVYNISSGGDDKKALAVTQGTNNASFSTDFTYFINTYSSAEIPPVYTLHKAINGKKVKDIKDNGQLLQRLESYAVSPKEFSTISINGNDLNMYMIKPKDFDSTKKYPLFMYQYSGPGSQNVSNSWMGANDYWHQGLVAEGYIVACVDGRGTGFKGRDFKKVTQKELGKYEVEDQIAAAKKLSELPYIDESRTGIWGWSYGGFMSTNCILKGNDTFEMAIAVAPVTSWAFYDTIYTERYMQTPQENPSGYDDNSPFNYPHLLEGDYLLIHGTGDDNVHVQNSMRMIEALIQADKQFDWGIYPDKNHGIYGGNTRIHLYNKMTNFIKEKL